MTILLARVLAGISAGGCFTSVPIYVKEISQDNIRGKLGSISGLAMNVGMLVMYALGSYLNYFTVLWIVMAVPIITFVLMLKAPESPAFLIKMGKVEEATRTLGFLRGLDINDKEIQTEIDSLKDEDLYSRTQAPPTFSNILRNRAWRRGLLVMVLIITAHAMNGNFTILSYASEILSKSGVTISPELQALSFPAIMIISSIISLSVVEKIGRKPLLAGSFGLAAVALSCLATSLLMQKAGGEVPGWLPTVAIIFEVSAYALGIAPVPFIVMSELFNFQIRSKLLSFIACLSWSYTFVQVMSYTSVSNALGQHVTFYYFSILNLFGAAVTLTLLPETKGKSVEQIEMELQGKTNVNTKDVENIAEK